MNVNDLLKRLSYGPLSNLAISNEGDGTIVATKIPAIVGFANDGLLRLHSRFLLVEKELILEQDETITRYTITSKNAVSNLDTDPTIHAYIRDTEAEPYLDDLIRVISVFDGDGCRVPLNDELSTRSVFTPQFNVLQVPFPIQGQPLYLMYQARHPTLLDTVLADPIVLPDYLEGALVSYVAHKVFSAMNGQEHTAKANEHLSNYENVCNEAVANGLVSSTVSTTAPKFDQRGFQ